ncbi:hypothetical protein NQ315_008331 [Exocentrus adspersus]|uniref:Tyr recombinase domain-containing protein n=1 Tax=Exocentrus adspersus TaxID=1586481 RepID=A0AAV8VBA5_9CUCU|nr:hypothetical protein NQ315_008331 [Exocentrus adspersus]
MGGVQFPRLTNLSRLIWQWCEHRSIWLYASYIPSRENFTADDQSRNKEINTEWELADWAFTRIVKKFGEPQIDCFASRANKKCNLYISWNRDPDSVTIDAFTVAWNNYFFYAFPPFSLILRVLKKIILEKAEGILVVPLWSAQPWYPVFTSLLLKDPVIFKPNGHKASLGSQTYIDSSTCIREAYSLKNLPVSSYDILLASISNATLKQYDSALKQWWQFCLTNKMCPFKFKVNDLLSFLSLKYNEGASYGSLNTMRAAISLISFNTNTCKDQVVTRFFKGVFRKRPLRPKYKKTWDVSIVLNFIKTYFPLESLSLKKVTEKLLMLLAIITAHRAQTLTLINIDNIKIFPSKIEIMIPDTIKTSGPASTLIHYLDRTKSLRNNVKNLFISFKKPHKAVVTQTISRWIKSVLYKSGINTSQYTAHSVRHAATSKAFKKGISLDIIRATAGWTKSSSVFEKFYNKPIAEEDHDFALSVLND